jgi:hypothetical protein
MNKPNPESKTSRIILQALAFDEKAKIVTFKKLCRQDGITEKDMMLEALDLLFVKHRLQIGGNPQTQVDSPLFTGEAKQFYPLSGRCGFSGCKGEAVGVGIFLPKNKEYQLCSQHLTHAKNSGKIWRFS